MGQQVVGQQHRLCPLEVGVAGQVGLASLVGSVSERFLKVGDQADDLTQFPHHPEPQVGGHLVVAAPAGVEAGSSLPGQFGDPPLYRRVDVLVVGCEGERVVGHLSLDDIQGVKHRLAVGLLQQPDVDQHPHVGSRPGDVVGVEPPVDGQAVVQGP